MATELAPPPLSRPARDAAVKRRARRRQRDRGAVIFIVAMTLAVLAALGLYAMEEASNEVKTSGYSRQATQAHYMSEYGVLGGTQGVNPQTAQLYLGLMTNTARRDTSCISLPHPKTVTSYTQLACRRMGSLELAQAQTWPNQKALAATDPFGPYPLGGDFYVELTDPVQAQPPTGFDLRLGLCFAQFTVTSVGLLQPNVSATTQEKSFFGNEGLEMARARIVAGPIRCQQ